MKGTSIITWHDNKKRYDEVIWDPHPRSRDEAYLLAEERLLIDNRATRVHIAYSELNFVEVCR